ncbi:hypothetical protein CEXT_763141 [Caerostris extrusa]|uniref:Uncharacterized protein n=1 Tax=Caerostris extrusa TaxID=172846 RepID=A0AAV4MS01_CAEEX|nr:hypothetical protein CEXT_763141 [Caerostris extrusa]
MKINVLPQPTVPHFIPFQIVLEQEDVTIASNDAGAINVPLTTCEIVMFRKGGVPFPLCPMGRKCQMTNSAAIYIRIGLGNSRVGIVT